MSRAVAIDLNAYIRDVPNFPKPGIIFKDITPLLLAPDAFAATVEMLADPFRDQQITKVAAIESRGFIFGAGVALQLGCGFVPIRKPGKLPWTTYRHEYTLEYGSDALEVHNDAFDKADRVLVVDDVLATGGTGAAAVALVNKFSARAAGLAVVIELDFLNGRSRMNGTTVHSLIHYS